MTTQIGIFGSKMLSQDWLPIISDVVKASFSQGRMIVTGNSLGAEAFAIKSATEQNPETLDQFLKIFTIGDKFAEDGYHALSARQELKDAKAAGAKIIPWAGGEAEVNLGLRLQHRLDTMLESIKQSSPNAGVIGFVKKDDTRGAFRIASKAQSLNLSVVIFPLEGLLLENLPLLDTNGRWEKPAETGLWKDCYIWRNEGYVKKKNLLGKEPRALLIDGKNVFFRYHHGAGDAVTQFLTNLSFWKRQYTHIFVCADPPNGTFRHTLYPDYKGTRQATPDDLSAKIEDFFSAISKLNIPVILKDGYEADDVIGTIAKNSPMRVAIISSDRDLAQLVDDQTELLRAKGPYTKSMIKDEMGVEPLQVPAYKALVGDSSDNIPGVYGIGTKTAKQLLMKFGTLDEVYKNLWAIPDKTSQKLQDGKSNAYFFQMLTTLADVDMPDFDFEAGDVTKFL